MKLYNTLTRKVEEFKPRARKKVQMFVCGPTVYDFSHIGHAKTYTQLDVLARVLRVLGYDVTYLQNVTDIDDKILMRAKERNIGWEELSAQYRQEYLQDMDNLGNTSVTTYARATDHIQDIIHQVQVLLDKGNAYKIDDGIYFEIATFPDYGKLSGRTEVQKDDAQTRIDHSEEKKGWNDFCLWKFSKPDEPSWDAPFGAGRPGWHIEDTAITEHFFGPQYDIHGGAVDLIFPHHEAEITQMESASGKVPFVRYWTHTGFLNINDEKMSKSAGNFFTIREVLEKGYDPIAIRFFMLQSHYRSSINFSWELLDAAATRLQSLRALAVLGYQTTDDQNGVDDAELDYFKEQIEKALANDINTPEALAALSSLETLATKRLLSSSGKEAFAGFLGYIDDVFGLDLSKQKDISDEQKLLVSEREDARKAKDWAKSDELRGKLAKQGIQLNDTEFGPVWSWS